MRQITDIIIHCAATPNGKDFHAIDIDTWHIERGFRRDLLARDNFNPEFKAIGYHFVIPINGFVETGRSVEESGAHCAGCNAHSIGICLIGTDKFTKLQWESLKTLLENLKHTYPSARIKGHYEYDSAKAQGKICPSFDVPSYLVDFVPDDKHKL